MRGADSLQSAPPHLRRFIVHRKSTESFCSKIEWDVNDKNEDGMENAVK